jgi:raffinose/stachyose/melibiose transport system permease protein
VAVVWTAPVVFVVFTSLKSSGQILTGTSYLPPRKVLLENYPKAWATGDLGRATINSLIIATVKGPLGLFISAMAAYAFTRLHFVGRKLLFTFFLLGTMIPVQVALGPLF